MFADYGWRYGTACNLDTDARLNGGDAGTSQNCRIDIGDPRTDSNGEVTVGLAHSSESAVNWIYAWAGTLGQEFNESEVRSEVKRKIDWQPSPSRVTTIDPIGIVYEQGLAIVARLVGPNSAGQRMVLVSSYDNVVRVMRVETTNDDGSVASASPVLPTPARTFSNRARSTNRSSCTGTATATTSTTVQPNYRHKLKSTGDDHDPQNGQENDEGTRADNCGASFSVSVRWKRRHR